MIVLNSLWQKYLSFKRATINPSVSFQVPLFTVTFTEIWVSMPVTAEFIAFWNLPCLFKYYSRARRIYYLQFKSVFDIKKSNINTLLISQNICKLNKNQKCGYSEAIYAVSAVELTKQNGLKFKEIWAFGNKTVKVLKYFKEWNRCKKFYLIFVWLLLYFKRRIQRNNRQHYKWNRFAFSQWIKKAASSYRSPWHYWDR
jgi:hypothetical protein